MRGPTSSQRSKRHVVAINDAIRTSANSIVTAPSSPMRIEYRSHSANDIQHSCISHADHMVTARDMMSWTGGVLSSKKANLLESLREDCLDEVPPPIEAPLPERQAPFVASTVFELRRAAPITNGFAMLDNSIMRLVHRLPESTLEDKFTLISNWIDSYHVDVIPRKLATQLSLLLRMDDGPQGDEGQSDEGHGSSGKCRTSVKDIIAGAFAIHQLTLVLVRMKPLLGPVVHSALRHTFNGLFSGENPLSTMPNELIDVTMDRETLASTLRHFQQRTFFQDARDASRRMAAVQEFVAQYEKVKRRQMEAVKRQIEGGSTTWISVCFRSWRGQVQKSREERQKAAALSAMQAERDKLLVKVAGLEAVIATRDKTIEDLKEKMAQQQSRAEIAQGALHYDVHMLTQELAKAQSALSESLDTLRQSQRSNHVLNEKIRSNETALRAQLRDLRASILLPRHTTIAREAWSAVAPKNDVMTSEVVAKWVRKIALEVLTKHHADYLESDECTPAFKEAVCASSGPLRYGHQGVNCVAMCIYGLFHQDYPLALSWDHVRLEMIGSTILMNKLLGLIHWCSVLHIPIGCALHEYLLMEENSVAIGALALRLLMTSISPTMSFSFRASEFKREPIAVDITDDPMEPEASKRTVLLSPLEPVWEDLRQTSLHGKALSMCDKFFATSQVPKLPWALLESSQRSLSIAETADRGAFTLSAKDLANVVQVPQDEQVISAIQHIIKLHFLFLRQAFLVYAGFDSGNAVSATLSDYGLTKMMRDARIGIPGVVDTGIIKGLAGDGLSAKRFAVALVQTACMRFPDRSAPDGLVTLINRMKTTLTTPALEGNLLAAIKEHETFNQIFDELRPDLMKVFRKYCVEAPAGNRMTNAELSKMLQELKVVDDSLNPTEVGEAFALVGPTGGTIVFEQFCWLLCTLAVMRIRSPWVPPVVRMTRFVYDMVISPLQKKLQLTAVSL